MLLARTGYDTHLSCAVRRARAWRPRVETPSARCRRTSSRRLSRWQRSRNNAHGTMPTEIPNARDTMPRTTLSPSTVAATRWADGRAVRCRDSVHQSGRVEDMRDRFLECRGLGDNLFSRHAQHVAWPVPGEHLVRGHLPDQRPRGMSPNGLVERDVQIEQMTLAAMRRHQVTDHPRVPRRREDAFQQNVIALLQSEARGGPNKRRRDSRRRRGIMFLQHDAPKIVLLDQRQAASESRPYCTCDGGLAGSGVSTDDNEFAGGHRRKASAVRASRPTTKSGGRVG
jgi:hypothetical protein